MLYNMCETAECVCRAYSLAQNDKVLSSIKLSVCEFLRSIINEQRQE